MTPIPVTFLERFQSRIRRLLMTRGRDLLRSRGMPAFSDESRWFGFQGVQMVLSGAPQRSRAPDEALKSPLVFVGRNLDGDALYDGFMSCAD